MLIKKNIDSKIQTWRTPFLKFSQIFPRAGEMSLIRILETEILQKQVWAGSDMT